MTDWRAEVESIIRDGDAPGMFHAGHPQALTKKRQQAGPMDVLGRISY